MLKDFVISQLLNDEEWNAYIQSPETYNLHAEQFDGEPVEIIRHAIVEGMKEEETEVNAITANPATPTFGNTVVALSNSGAALERATAVMYNLLSAETSDELDALANEMAPALSEHGNNIMLNEQLFARVKYVRDKEGDQLAGEDKMLLDKLYESFERSGATLAAADKETFRELTKQLSEQTLLFSQNLLKETNNFILHITDEAELDGLPEIHRQAAAEAASERKLDGWVFTLHAPNYGPFMMYAKCRRHRETLYKAYNSRATKDNANCNFGIVQRIVDLRREVAQLLGYKDYAEYALKRRMAENAHNVYALLDDLVDNYLARAKDEVAEVAALAKQTEGNDFEMQPWDFSYYSQKLKKQLYDYDPDMLRPYFELSRVKQGVFGLASRLYGVTFEENKHVAVYQDDVTAYNVYDEQHRFLAILYLDFFPRATKKGGAWMTDYRAEYCDDNAAEVTPANSMRPVVSVTTNFTKPTADKPALLTLGEVQTFLHEFGHALHGIFAMTRYASLSGTNVYWDFVELPSQFMENYAVEPEFLATFAYHYQTGVPLPADYIERIRKSRTFQAAYACIRQVSFGLLDMAYYTLRTPFEGSVKAFEEKAWSRVQLLPTVAESCMTTQFGHIMSGGYAAGYYSYKWAEVLDADAFDQFKQHGIFNAEVAASFRNNILSRGGTEHPMTLYKRFRGQEPTLNALLRRDGIPTTDTQTK